MAAGSRETIERKSVLVAEARYAPNAQFLSIPFRSELAPPPRKSQNSFPRFSASNLYFYRARYYNPTLERFISEDPLEFRGGDASLYGYVWNSPVNFIDPFGWWGLGVQGGASAGARLGGGAIGILGGGIDVFGGNGLNAGMYGDAGAFAGVGPYGPRYPDPPGSRNWDTGYVLGYGAGGGAGLFGTNAKNVCDLIIKAH
jgi:RHS repeat-associated protein